MLDRLSKWRPILGKPIRKLAPEKAIYITFDDGPDPELTPQVLDLLKEFGAKATFFVVAKKAAAHPEIIARIQKEGHAIGNHSLDHSYAPFFKGYSAMLQWIEESESILKSLNIQSIGFRPPVGIRTPELAAVLRNLNVPLILWQRRAFDTVIKFTSRKASSMAHRSQEGDILLLHDSQKKSWQKDFIKGLQTLIVQLSKKGFFLSQIDLNSQPSPHQKILYLTKKEQT
ncbi:MAG: polysaccharide deacetylase family protein [Bdellovibrionota bacterium]